MAKTGTGKHAPAAAQLRGQIRDGALGPGTWLPSEAQLMTAYGLTRYSAREAIKALAAEGLVVVVDGKGSYVRPRNDRPTHADPRGITTTGSGHHEDTEEPHWAEVEKPSTYRMNATADLALALGIAEHSPVFVYDRLLQHTPPGGHAGPGRRMLHRLHLPFTTCLLVPALEHDPFQAPSRLYNTLTDAGIPTHWAESVRAAHPTPDDATSLHLPPGALVLITRRATHDSTTGTVLAMEETRRNAEDTQLTYAITPSPQP